MVQKLMGLATGLKNLFTLAYDLFIFDGPEVWENLDEA